MEMADGELSNFHATAQRVATALREEMASFAQRDEEALVYEIKEELEGFISRGQAMSVERMGSASLTWGHRLGRRRALQGLPLTDVLRGCAIACREVLRPIERAFPPYGSTGQESGHIEGQPLVGALTDSQDGEGMSGEDGDRAGKETLRFVGRILDVLIQVFGAVIEEYVEASAELRDVRHHASQELARRVAAGELEDTRVVERLAEEAGWRMRAPFLAIVGELDTFVWPADLRCAREVVSQVARTDEAGVLVAAWDRRMVALVSMPRGRSVVSASWVGSKLRNLLGAPVAVGVGTIQESRNDLRVSYLDAVRSLELAMSLWGSSGAASFDEVLVFDVLRSGERPVHRLHERLVKPLIRGDPDRGNHLLVTAEVLAEEGFRVLPAARRLNVHRHTVEQRVKRIQELSGLDLRDPDDRLGFVIALRANRLFSTKTPSRCHVEVDRLSGP